MVHDIVTVLADVSIFFIVNCMPILLLEADGRLNVVFPDTRITPL